LIGFIFRVHAILVSLTGTVGTCTRLRDWRVMASWRLCP